ncbi:hypothetical protein llap_11795 [Limosa lapponica baueri]|uniref:Uncharacterized protein n=1 Tax=Limosa lapponica baueri TaxID=1758121 RepID=A0A2I0TW04_LIMLA|nr:hypothetical protein llap_11795 [Limosa lapponica baueri]
MQHSWWWEIYKSPSITELLIFTKRKGEKKKKKKNKRKKRDSKGKCKRSKKKRKRKKEKKKVYLKGKCDWKVHEPQIRAIKLSSDASPT